MEERGYWANLRRRRVGRREALLSGSAAAGLAALALAGCGDDDDDGPASTGTAAPAGQPKRGGVIRPIAGTAGEQPHHDPHQTTTGLHHVRGSGIVFSRLLRRKLGPDNSAVDHVPEGDLAASWEQADDLTFVFKINPAAKWQNIAPVSGRAVTAEDVAYSWNRQLELRAAAALLPQTKRVAAVDAQTLRVELARPDPDFLVALTAAENKVVAREVVEQKGDLKEGPVIGSGAWIFKDWTPNNKITFTRNPDYFRQGLPYADGLEILRISDASTHVAAFRNKQVHMFSGNKLDIDGLRSSIRDLKVQEERRVGPITGPSLVIRADTPPGNDIRVRQAISKAIDRQAIITTVLSGLGWLGGTLLSVTSTDDLLSEDELKKLLAKDTAGAKQLLQQAGFSGWSPRMVFLRTSADDTAAAEQAHAQLKEIGVTPTLTGFDNVQMTGWWNKRDENLGYILRGARVGGPNADLINNYKTGGARNVANLSDPELDRLIDAQGAEVKDRGRRRQLLQQAQRRIIELAAVTPGHSRVVLTAYWPTLRNVFQGFSDDPGYYELLWLDE